jgi:hypothetical protein
MQTATVLLGEAREQTKLFLREEVELAKAELSEKAAHYREAATQAGIGAFVSYGALLVLFAGLGWLVSFVFQLIGLDLLPARAAGFGAVGVFVIALGAVTLLKGIKSLGRRSVTPEKTLHTIHRLQGSTQAAKRAVTTPSPPRRPSKQVEAEIIATEQRLGQNFQALVQRISPGYYVGKMAQHAQANPVRWNLAALVTGFAGSVWFVKKLKR